ncbi:hypothetical protein CHLNCDRAFT_21935 [Chlorella variabilis]|uniref:SRP54-type proteins GTP-binding domain-containing protein n=1 Tax=Chlorella variabilis TaxID=554065 RepID=E1ZBK3_CHLVA|nr:hypothetical protein CHLNCDRAFT_21935 [Chlorella variabilis]EFN56873.1 hypothetical protein CHLNCDRAFT_21935 [Chlorella variabilis]|eukprot:XP_005848975.1 hypothetical protein CHLNCDRAFT_21935 [Chlorella variabilis]
MLDHVCIFTKGGSLLWVLSFVGLKGDPINTLIRACLLEERAGQSSFEYIIPSGGTYALKWSLNNGLGLVFVAVYQKALKLLYVDELLERMNRAFAPRYKPGCFEYPDFDATFQRLLKDCEEKAEAARRPSTQQLAPAQVGAAAGQQRRASGAKTGGSSQEGDSDGTADGGEAAAAAAAPASGSDAGPAGDSAGQSSDDAEGEDGAANGAASEFVPNLDKLKKLGKRAGPGGKVTRHHADRVEEPKKKAPAGKKGKQARVWGDAANGKEEGPLDFTEGEPGEAQEVAADLNQRSLIDVEEEVTYDELEEEEEAAAAGAPKKGGLLSSFVRTIGVNVALTRTDIEPALATLKKKLMERNVAEEIADKVTESVATSLEGRKLASFTRVSTAVQQAVEEALTRILTPKRSIDVLREVKAVQAKGQPYTIVFVGVNGVGKSTNLAKVAYWLLQNGVKVMIAACDTFRSGAVEQLKTHCARLQVPLYERGYEKDPAKVAFEAAKAAQRSGIDVLLVDTAGRMQDNEPLMRALSNLINLNQPDLVLFVGEALVGNDAVDQLTKFNQRLADLCPDPTQRHLIDGIVLTKFDTIDDKVGAALSMVYTSGAPIMFVGCGQTYVDLKKLHVKSVVKSLLK